MEDFSVGTCRDPERFAARFAAVAPHPGALTALGLGPNGHGGEIAIHPQGLLVEAVMGRDPIALQIIPRHLFVLGDVLRGTGPQSPRNGRLLRTACPPTGPLHRTIRTDGDIVLGNRLGPTEDPAQGIEQFVDGAIADHFLWDLYLFPQWGKETVPPQILS